MNTNSLLKLIKATLIATATVNAFSCDVYGLGEKVSADAKKAKESSSKTTGHFDLSKGFSSVAEKVIPSVVNISTTQIIEGKGFGGNDMPKFSPGSPFDEFFKEFLDQFDKPRRVQALGSGFIIKVDEKVAWVVTNYHVIQDAKKITIFMHDKSEAEATVHSYDAGTDLALLKFNIKDLPEDKRSLQALAWGDSADMKVGDWVVACGNPFGLFDTITTGIISSKGRNIMPRGKNGRASFDVDFIQHDASINMGNSGGPLVNLKGEVIAINTLIYSPTGGNVGLGFAIPSKLAKSIIDQLIEKGRISRGYLGIRIQNVTPGIAESLGLKKAKGAIVGSVTAKGPGEKAGIKDRDVILEFEGKEIVESTDLSRMVRETPIGTKVKLKVWRGGKEETLTVVVEEMEEGDSKTQPINGEKQRESAKQTAEILGLKVSAISEDIKKHLQKQKKSEEKDQDQKQSMLTEESGIIILSVDPNSDAAELGLREGDIIVDVMVDSFRYQLNTPADFVNAIEKARSLGKKSILLMVSIEGERRFVSLDIVEDKNENEKKTKNKKKTDLTPDEPTKKGESKEKTVDESVKTGVDPEKSKEKKEEEPKALPLPESRKSEAPEVEEKTVESPA